jgi:hypothetical protein
MCPNHTGTISAWFRRVVAAAVGPGVFALDASADVIDSGKPEPNNMEGV